MSGLWMVTYDISNHKNRRLVSKVLLDYGVRVQYSIFECRLKRSQLETLRIEVTKLIEATDKVRWYPLCSWCEAGLQWQGVGEPVVMDEYHML